MLFSAQLPEFTLYLEGSGKISDAGLLMRKLYDYWYHKGYWGAVSASAVDFLNALAVLIIVALFTVRFQWSFALRCATDAECASLPLMSGVSFPYLFGRTALGYLTGFALLSASCAAAFYEGVNCVANVFLLREIEVMVRDTDIDPGFLTPFHRLRHNQHRASAEKQGHEAVGLGQDSRQVLSLMSWGSFLERMCGYLSAEKKLKRSDGGVHLDALRAMQILMQRENFLIALYDNGLLERGALQYLSPETVGFLISSALDPFGVVYPEDEGLWKVRERSVRYAVVHLALFVFVAAFAVLKLLVKNAGQFKTNFRDLSQRTWNNRATWCFRLYNEAAYLHACRLASGREKALSMTERLAVSNNTRHLLRRLSSACILVTIVLTFLNPSLLTGGKVCGLTLVWWLTIALLVFSAAGVPDPREREYVYRDDLAKLVDQVHFLHAEWTWSGEAFYNHITSRFFKPQVLLSIDSLLRSLAAPFALLYALRDGSVTELLTFLREQSAIVDGVGSVPVDAIFEKEGVDIGVDGEEDMATQEGSARSLLLPHAAPSDPALARGRAAGRWSSALDGARQEKMEKSIASFCSVYQQWMAERLSAAQTDRDSRNQPLYDFVQDLHTRVQDRVAGSRPYLGGSAVPLAGDGEGQLFESLNHSWVPPFTARDGQRAADCGYSPRATEALSASAQSTLMLDPREITTHEREQLFVSEVWLSHAHSRVGGRRGEEGAHTGYGTGQGQGGRRPPFQQHGADERQSYERV